MQKRIIIPLVIVLSLIFPELESTQGIFKEFSSLSFETEYNAQTTTYTSSSGVKLEEINGMSIEYRFFEKNVKDDADLKMSITRSGRNGTFYIDWKDALINESTEIVRSGDIQKLFKSDVKISEISSFGLIIPYFKSKSFDEEFEFEVSHLADPRFPVSILHRLSFNGVIRVKGKYQLIGLVSTTQAKEAIKEFLINQCKKEIEQELIKELDSIH